MNLHLYSSFFNQKPLLPHVGWDLLRRLISLLNVDHDGRIKVGFLIDQIGLFCNPKEIYVMALETLEAYQPNSDPFLAKISKLIDIFSLGLLSNFFLFIR